jgi:thiazole/oxazole-forming peptide maturase SagC family component
MLGAARAEVVDHPLLRNTRLFNENGALLADRWPPFPKPPCDYESWWNGFDTESLDCLVATSDFGGLQLMREWNSFCVDHHCHFFPVVLQDLIGYVGPLIVPGETACFECLRSRQDANMSDPVSQRASEYAAPEGRKIVGFIPPMASVLGDIAAVELVKFYGRGLPLWRVGTLIEVNLLAPRLEMHRVLKLPRCPVCSPLNRHSPPSLTRNVFKIGPPVEE